MIEIEPMFDEEGFRHAVSIETDFLSEALSERIVDIARVYFREALGKYSETFLEQATEAFKGQLASVLFAGIRTQKRLPEQPEQPDAPIEW